MKIVFRADASHQIGSGHVMRCLTLADASTENGADFEFICRQYQGHLAEYIRAKGYRCHLLDQDSAQANIAVTKNQSPALQHADWLDVPWHIDAKQTATILETIRPDWLVVDHYALDHNWEQALQPYYDKLMVVDDLADRQHSNAHILLDQTFGRLDTDYRALVNPATKLMLGADYALLRPEFAAWRERSLQRRESPRLETILINLGGVDNDNVTGEVLDALPMSRVPDECKIVVVMGAAAPHLASVQQQVQALDLNIEVLAGVNNMAELMAHADLAIGAAGATSWERCCLGLPTIMVVLAQNQQLIANELSRIGACEVVSASALKTSLPTLLNALSVQTLKAMSTKARSVCAGDGTSQVIHAMVSASSEHKRNE
ncbi:MAG: UDP-2,4-diacetamido-2,4,6-trideoxy-beta-L-altropyranose hydrolase [Idiomarina sp.]|nr:UDP-2,4-diacetamido-2,4,6-trideoxy-beta-L-altropyranose hydrolase [Idiomarina sp.]